MAELLVLVQDLTGRGVALRSLAEQIDTSSAAGRLVLHVFGALAEFERALMHERTMAGLAASRVRGRVGAAHERSTPLSGRTPSNLRRQ